MGIPTIEEAATARCAHVSNSHRGVPRAGINVSVIIPVLNEEKVIGKCLESLCSMHYPQGAFEVIIIDNGSTDGTLEVLKSYSTRLNLRVLSKARVSISALRNLGVAAARGEILAFLDADCIPPPTWLSQGSVLLSTGDCDLVGGYYFIPEKSSWVAKAWCGDEAINKRGSVSYLPSGDLLMRRSNFLKVGGFDETIETNEDYEFCQRARRTGLRIMSFPEMGVTHLGTPQTLPAFYRQQRWHGKHVVRVFVRNVAAFPNGKAVLLAMYVLLCLIGLALGSCRAVASGRLDLVVWFVGALLTAPLVLAGCNAIYLGKWGKLLPLSVLYLVYGIARAICLVDPRNVIPRRERPMQLLSQSLSGSCTLGEALPDQEAPRATGTAAQGREARCEAVKI